MIREKTPDYILDEYDAQEFIYLLQLKTPQEKLLYARARIGVSQKDIANYMKVHQVTVSRIEKDPLANQELLYKYCEAVEVDKSWIESRSIGRPFDYSLENAPRMCAIIRIMEEFGEQDELKVRDASLSFANGSEIAFLEKHFDIDKDQVKSRLIDVRSRIIGASTREMSHQLSVPLTAINATERWTKPHFGYIASLILKLGINPEWLIAGNGNVFDVKGMAYQEIKETVDHILFSVRNNLDLYSFSELDGMIKTIRNISLKEKTKQ
ncbi:TPA: helix-turn-helix transcriptional regulator [Vibrio parahaemolyticus]|nr:helix-turn-helix transcriptional regulator [Vibrio parahaemolyticus]